VFCSHGLCSVRCKFCFLANKSCFFLEPCVAQSLGLTISNCGIWGRAVWLAVVWYCVCRLRSQWPVACLTVLETNGRLNAVPSSLCASWDTGSSARCGKGSGTTQPLSLSRRWNQVSHGPRHNDPKVLVCKVVMECQPILPTVSWWLMLCAVQVPWTPRISWPRRRLWRSCDTRSSSSCMRCAPWRNQYT
jgi:hypothetical protein